MLEWYQPDPIFSFFNNAKTKEEFAQNWVVKDHFHTKVPEDITKSYETVEYLMAHAWYHWPMFDEALRKLLGMVEMAVKFRCNEKGINIYTGRIDKKGRKIGKNLSTLIDELSEDEPAKEFKNVLEDVRELRNYYAHPKDHNFMGGIAVDKIKNLVNIINFIFLEEAECIAAKAEKARLELELAGFREGLFVLESSQPAFLITETRLLEVFKAKDEWVYMCKFDPVILNFSNTFSEQRFPHPHILALTQVDIKDNVLEAVDMKTVSGIKLYPTTASQHYELLSQYRQEWDQLDEKNQSVYKNYTIDKCRGEVRDFMYEYRWINPQSPSSI